MSNGATSLPHPPEAPANMIAILDYGSQYTQLIARKIRSLGVFAEIFPPETTPVKI